MRYKIKLKPKTIVLMFCIHCASIIGAILLGNSMPREGGSSDPISVALACFILFCGLSGTVSGLQWISFEEVDITDISKELEDEVNQRVKIKINDIIDKLNDK